MPTRTVKSPPPPGATARTAALMVTAWPETLGLALDPLAEDLADDGLGASERDIVKDAQREKLADKRPDPLLRESAAILSDAIDILGQDRKLSAQVLPDSPGPGRWAQ